jgi:hypothetical protein
MTAEQARGARGKDGYVEVAGNSEGPNHRKFEIASCAEARSFSLRNSELNGRDLNTVTDSDRSIRRSSEESSSQSAREGHGGTRKSPGENCYCETL